MGLILSRQKDAPSTGSGLIVGRPDELANYHPVADLSPTPEPVAVENKPSFLSNLAGVLFHGKGIPKAASAINDFTASAGKGIVNTLLNPGVAGGDIGYQEQIKKDGGVRAHNASVIQNFVTSGKTNKASTIGGMVGETIPYFVPGANSAVVGNQVGSQLANGDRGVNAAKDIGQGALNLIPGIPLGKATGALKPVPKFFVNNTIRGAENVVRSQGSSLIETGKLAPKEIPKEFGVGAVLGAVTNPREAINAVKAPLPEVIAPKPVEPVPTVKAPAAVEPTLQPKAELPAPAVTAPEKISPKVVKETAQGQIDNYKKEGILITDKDKPVVATIGLDKFHGEKTGIQATQTTIDQKGVDLWKKRIQSGERPAVLVDFSGKHGSAKVVDGHTRLTAYKELGINSIPVIDRNGKLKPLYEPKVPKTEPITPFNAELPQKSPAVPQSSPLAEVIQQEALKRPFKQVEFTDKPIYEPGTKNEAPFNTNSTERKLKVNLKQFESDIEYLKSGEPLKYGVNNEGTFQKLPQETDDALVRRYLNEAVLPYEERLLNPSVDQMIRKTQGESTQVAQEMDRKASEGILTQKTSKVASSINEKSIEKGLTKGFSGLAGYEPVVIKDQAARAAKVMNTDLERAKQMVRGEIPMEPGLKGEMLIKAMEDHAVNTGDVALLRDLASSPLVSETSAHAQAMRLLAERDPNSALARIKELGDARAAVVEKKTGQKAPQLVKATANEIRQEVAKARPGRQSWAEFITELQCK